MNNRDADSGSSRPVVMQVVHGYNAPFFELANRYAELFDETAFRVLTVYLSGAPSEAVAQATHADSVRFLALKSGDLRGLKLKAIRRVRALIRQYRPSAIIAHRYKSIYLSLLASTRSPAPVIGVAHAFGVFASPGRRGLARAFRRRLHLLGVSNAVRDDLRASLPSLPRQRIRTQYNCVDVAGLRELQLPRDEARRLLGLPENAFVFANVGRLHPDKDQGTLLRAFALALPEMPGSQLVLVGQGREEARYRALCEELGIVAAVRFAGFMDNAERCFRAFDCYVSSSHREPFGMVLLEAMAAELPLISTDCGGGGEVAENVGRLFTRGDERQLAAAMRDVYNAPDAERIAAGRAGLEKARARYDLHAFRRSFWSLGWI